MRYVCSFGSRVVLALALVSGVLAVPASAQDVVSEESRPFLAAAAAPQIPLTPRRGEDTPRTSLRDAAGRPSSLLPLYASLGVLQGLDIHSTGRGLAAGGREANPVMTSVVENRAAYVAVKAATTAGIIWAAERLWRKEHRKAAVILTAVTNVGLAAVVAHNYRAAK